MESKKSQKVSEKKKYSEPSLKEIGKINSKTFGGSQTFSADSSTKLES